MATNFAATAPHPPAPITRFSELGTPTEKMRWWAPLGFILVTISTLIIVSLLVVLSPLILIEIVVRRMVVGRFKYHRQPSDLKIAIVGGGWAGLQSLARFKELGTDNVDLFERYDNVGGTFNKNLSYNGLQIHGSMVITSFDNFPFSEDPDIMHGKVQAPEMEKYIHSYVEAFDLKRHCNLNSNVEEVNYDSKTSKATITITDSATGAKRHSGEYDLVIWASTAAYGNIPHIPGEEKFKGKQMHTTSFKTADFEDILKNNKKVVVVGSGKAGADFVLSFVRSGYNNFVWLMRKNYLFYKFEVLFHNGTIGNKIRGFTYLCTMLWAAVSNRFTALLHWASGYLYTFGKPHTDFTHFHGGILCATQRKDLNTVPYSIGEPVEFNETGAILKDGSHIDCDVLIWATGNKTGIETLKLKKDGEPFHLDERAKLYNHFIVPEFPVFASSTAFFTTFGPLRGTNTAELAIHHLCVRGNRSEARMRKAANRQMSLNSLHTSFLWIHDGNWIREWVYFHLDLVFAGVTSLEDFLNHALTFFAFSKDNRLRLNILPKGTKN